MKQVLRELAKRITRAMDRLGEDFNMLLMEDILPYPSDPDDREPFDDELFV